MVLGILIMTKNDKKNIAVIIPLNDINEFQGGSKSGQKQSISYFDMFLMLYESIKGNWKKEKFYFKIILLHSLPFSYSNQEILEKLDITQIKVEPADHPLKLRPIAYTIDIDCDYRLILDADMIALQEPCFDFNKDIQAMYGGNKFNRNQWDKICCYFGIKTPNYLCLRLKPGRYGAWRVNENFIFNALNIFGIEIKLFPYFNNGAILVKNEISNHLGTEFIKYRRLYTEYIYKTESIDIDLEGQDVIGLAIDNITKNWSSFDSGINFIIQEKYFLTKLLVKIFPYKRVCLFHYINLQENNLYLDKLNYYRDLIDRKYRNISN